MTRYSTIITLLLFITLSSDTFARQSNVKIEVRGNSRDGYTFYANNQSPSPFIVTIDFTTLRNLRASTSLPYSRNVSRGRSRLFNLTKEMDNFQTNYRYRYRTHTGCLNTEPDDIEYLLPYPEGVKARSGELSYVYNRLRKDAPEDWYSIVFYMEDDSIIHAARKGTVVSIRDGENSKYEGLVFSSNRNYVVVAQDDCTFARYSTFRDDKIFVDIGDTVYPGDPLGEMAGEEFGFGNQIRLLIYYRNDESVTLNREDSEGIHQWHYVKPKFRTSAGKSQIPESGSEYTSIHPEEVITEEMGRRERRRWRRNN
ncbi:M23 family metallopeptidase [Rhodohalobacter sp.]|uniref:M23 family metallopeptidase n=1 Tax=Rhodohalobacter sp. TaxID=1974210 RepID=UPI002ACE18DB|nr:M23 family metallopeptidase [Rhodohalobacter sp.]MDZ7757017.1 M23 family metallopeptidase [Rhodohalobacter sp.]